MNVNQLLQDHQVALLKAQHAPSLAARTLSAIDVDELARRITAWRKFAGLSAVGWPFDRSPRKSGEL